MKNQRALATAITSTNTTAATASLSRSLPLVALLVALLMMPVAGHACCGIGPQYPDFHDDSPSQDDSSFGRFAIAYEDFTPLISGPVTRVTWWGSFFNPPVEAPISAFTLEFYSDAGNAPGTLLAHFTVAGNASETFVQANDLGYPTFQYSAPVSFDVTAGTQYWLSIVPDLDYPPEWGWQTSSQGDGLSYQCFFADCGYFPSDLAFDLSSSTTTPEPASLALLGSAVLGIGGILRRRLLG